MTIKEALVSVANHLDAKGLRKEADYLDGVIKRLAGVDTDTDTDTDAATDTDANPESDSSLCESFSTALEAARENVKSSQKAFGTICAEDKWSRACKEAQVEFETAINQFDQADDNYKQCM
jgi:hypothetical protein